MKNSLILSLLTLLTISLFCQPVTAADCSGPWNTLPSRTPGMAPCAQLGLDTHRGVCKPGQAYETLCDDAKDGRYRICQGPQPCNNYAAPPPTQGSIPCTNWDNDHNRPCPPGHVNRDCRGDCGPV